MVFPAYAGMILTNESIGIISKSVPRIRGDDPIDKVNVPYRIMCSPHTRG